MAKCHCIFDEDEDFAHIPQEIVPLGQSPNGSDVELHRFEHYDVVMHFEDLPESDLGLVDGVRCTSVIRTLIDCAPEMTPIEFDRCVQNALDRQLFRLAEAWERVAQPDMDSHPGARIFNETVKRLA